ncbi:hypothetical protein CRG98_005903 [Punica granatum]|uniref:Uncharacterized protein n=1 Tax=Punica granatum TaxID=22663 RepID=A0A2I0KYY4_PUNGR|nr:hypothetical protein CRG98_005903 [Punica granatum]
MYEDFGTVHTFGTLIQIMFPAQSQFQILTKTRESEKLHCCVTVWYFGAQWPLKKTIDRLGPEAVVEVIVLALKGEEMQESRGRRVGFTLQLMGGLSRLSVYSSGSEVIDEEEIKMFGGPGRQGRRCRSRGEGGAGFTLQLTAKIEVGPYPPNLLLPLRQIVGPPSFFSARYRSRFSSQICRFYPTFPVLCECVKPPLPLQHADRQCQQWTNDEFCWAPTNGYSS